MQLRERKILYHGICSATSSDWNVLAWILYISCFAIDFCMTRHLLFINTCINVQYKLIIELLEKIHVELRWMRFMNRRWKKCKLVAAVKFCFDYYQNLKERMRCTQVKLPATFADYHLLKSLLSTLKVFSLCFCCVRPVNRCAREIKYIAFLPSGIKPTIVTPTGPGTKGKYSGVMISFIFTLSHHYIVRIEFANEPMAIYVS